jgi:cytochrome c oxidase assembly protein subunit 15
MNTLSQDSGSGVSPALHRFAVLAASVTFILVIAGALVTSTGSAMAVPDWPLAFGRLIPAHWTAGVPFEYGHRVIAGTVSILTLIMAVWAWRVERRKWVKYMAFGAFAMVIVQAVLGGLTVLTDLDLPLAVSHAATGQAFFCVMVSMALFTNPRWETDPAPIRARPGPPLAPLAAATTGIIYLQILIGAVMRHMHAGLAIPDFPLSFGHLVPPTFTVPIGINYAHRCGALVVTAMVIWTAVRTFREYGDTPALRRPMIGLLALLVLQIALGATIVLTRRAVTPTTAHVAIGAAVFATSVVLTLRAWHLERKAREADELGAARILRRPAPAAAPRKVGA